MGHLVIMLDVEDMRVGIHSTLCLIYRKSKDVSTQESHQSPVHKVLENHKSLALSKVPMQFHKPKKLNKSGSLLAM